MWKIGHLWEKKCVRLQINVNCMQAALLCQIEFEDFLKLRIRETTWY